MALIQCAECGKQVSDKAKACPNCGCPVDINTCTEQESVKAVNDVKSIEDYDFSELNRKLGLYGRRHLFNIAVNYHYDIEDGALKAAFIYKYIIDKYPNSSESSDSRRMLDKLVGENPNLFKPRPKGADIEKTPSPNSFTKSIEQSHNHDLNYDWSWTAFFFTGLWALYNKLWGKFLISFAVSIFTRVVYKICYPAIIIPLTLIISDPDKLLFLSILIAALILLGPATILGIWFGKNGNKWINNVSTDFI